MKLKLKLGACAIAIVIAAPAMAAQSTYPMRPVRMLVPSTPGGSVDTLTRSIGTRLSEKWGSQVVVDNRPGAGGVIAAETTAKALPDGYTLLMCTVSSCATNVSLHKNLPYDPIRDFAPVTLVATQNLMLVVNPSIAASSVKDLVALAKASPGKYSFGSAGNGTGSHLSGELFKLLAGIDIFHVPYKGVAPALVDAIAGQISMNFPSIISGTPHARSGKLRALAVSGMKRSATVPELPTMIEAGVKGYESATWYAVLAPAKTPKEIVSKVNADVVAILRLPEVRDRLSKEGADPVGSTPQELSAYMKSEIDKWAKVIRAAGIQAN